jgi:peroxiredoxin
MRLLRNGESFPTLVIRAVGGGTLVLPDVVRGSFAVVLVYRGAWCPFCTTQLAGFAAEKAALGALGVKVVALSVDDERTTSELATRLSLDFPLGHSADAERVSEATGAFTNDNPKYLQPTAFTLTPKGTVMAATYSTQAVGRLVAPDLIKFVSFMKSKLAA